MKRPLIISVAVFLTGVFTTVYAQEKGIEWTQGLNLQQVKEKAKKENKFIFLDLYTTWCVPCKMMDNSVYTDEKIGAFMNSRFVSVRVQMDKTDKDDAAVKGLYPDVAEINRKFMIEGYPTFLFFGPDGEPVHKDMGALGVDLFLRTTKTALNAGAKYIDPLVLYNDQIADFDKGIINQETLPSTILTARRLNDTSHLLNLLKTHVDYVSGLTPKERFTTKNLVFWTKLNPGPATRIFGFFYHDAAIINKVMKSKDYAERVIDRGINDADVTNFIIEQSKTTKAVITDPNVPANKQTDKREADWKALENLLSSKYDNATVKRVLLDARIAWYSRYRNYKALTHYEVKKLKTYPFDIHDKLWGSMLPANSLAWNIFLNSTNKKELKVAARYAKYTVDCAPWPGNMDTYANLLYKLGKKEEAIAWEEKALANRKGDPGFTKTIDQMRKGEPTYKDNGARW